MLDCAAVLAGNFNANLVAILWASAFDEENQERVGILANCQRNELGPWRCIADAVAFDIDPASGHCTLVNDGFFPAFTGTTNGFAEQEVSGIGFSPQHRFSELWIFLFAAINRSSTNASEFSRRGNNASLGVRFKKRPLPAWLTVFLFFRCAVMFHCNNLSPFMPTTQIRLFY